ncbi:hypothetical protein M988_4426 [Hafnia paralvei ATCC 29927]|uniref:hypothetical protein n=1 Tax=Hafnia paralvei TaxID=546367 RepID=UPI0007E35157|nr:hypothetical protein [Hafnia paralvei]OAT35729.1 hypothetical protein M988_4426 [Hafnia paralvei ATCC 29927]
MKQNNHSLIYASPRTGMSILSIPDYSQLSETEIDNMAKAILDNCNVKVIFRTNEITSLVKKEGAND